jgi:SAM-dependent methyltransferase
MVHGNETPSAWVRRWSHLIPKQGSVLDVACGYGRHMRWLAQCGHPVTGIDRSPEAIAAAGSSGRAIQADIENGPWPLEEQVFDAVVVTNYLWRPLLARLVASVAPGGVLIYETFSEGNETVGKPSRSDFLLRPGELLRATSALQTVAFEDGFCAHPPRFLQRIVSVRKPGTSPAEPARFQLDATE